MMMTVAPEIEARIREKIESGEFERTDALLNGALRLLDRHKADQERLQRRPYMKGSRGHSRRLRASRGIKAWLA